MHKMVKGKQLKLEWGGKKQRKKENGKKKITWGTNTLQAL